MHSPGLDESRNDGAAAFARIDDSAQSLKGGRRRPSRYRKRLSDELPDTAKPCGLVQTADLTAGSIVNIEVNGAGDRT